MMSLFARRPQLSLVIGAYNMARELPRTIHTLSRAYQRDIGRLSYEIIVTDNGSSTPVDEGALRAIAPEVRVLRTENARPSPVEAINAAVAAARAPFVGLMIDGARMVSPGLLSYALQAHRLDRDALIGSYGFHLGPDVQMKSVFEGYDQAVEDRLLESIDWQANGYRLFEISVFAGSSSRGWFHPIAESNALFLPRTLWHRLGGLDRRFQSPGGGFVNLDFWARAVEAAGSPWMIVGEGSFHQVHGGAATNHGDDARRPMQEEYVAIRGSAFTMPDYCPRLIGQLRPECEALETSPSEAKEPEAREAGHRRVGAARNRPFAIDLPISALERIQAGTLKTRYKGLRFCKNPFDAVLYLQLLERLKPATIFEIGTSEGGSAVWLRDQARALGLSTHIVSADIAPPGIDADGIDFIKADANRLDQDLPGELLAASPHPWLVIEDSAHTFEATRKVLDVFDPHMESGDYLVVEDGVVADLPGTHYARFEDGPNRAVKDFLDRAGDRYEIDTGLCDFYGHNVTYCPNAWLRRR